MAPARAASGTLARHGDALGLGLDAHRLDGLAHELVQRHALQRPADVAGLQPGELEQVVDQRAERVDVGAHPLQVGPPRLAVTTMSSPTASASSRSEVIGVRRSCETAATRSRRAESDWSRAASSACRARRSSRWPPPASSASSSRRSVSRSEPRARRGHRRQAVADRARRRAGCRWRPAARRAPASSAPPEPRSPPPAPPRGRRRPSAAETTTSAARTGATRSRRRARTAARADPRPGAGAWPAAVHGANR